MKDYYVFLNNGSVIKIKAENFVLNYDKNSVKFTTKSNVNNVAIFNFDNITGFAEVHNSEIAIY